ncbi:hypothetical protein XBKB1_3920001 [Xenorhabdus bovienii str. kraussei Becker Underwood]|uniref:Uncharacterized protein n=1 Tax=Xenorhabdus bovienii str. kraussei Becker Underwood TaxID=1398204 RepID=A0A077PZN7_XENBV|nr:hypothetical protein XBKB1_3920001 [Xenorhabdus bovienii str. kraussei Becker Underwood]
MFSPLKLGEEIGSTGNNKTNNKIFLKIFQTFYDFVFIENI